MRAFALAPLLVCLALSADARTEALRWTQASSSVATSRFIAYWRISAGPVSTVDLGKPTPASGVYAGSLPNIPDAGTVSIYLTAVGADGMASDPSNTITRTAGAPPPPPPTCDNDGMCEAWETTANCAADCPAPPPPPPPPGAPGAVTDLAVESATNNSVTLTFREVTGGAGQPASYDVRHAAGTLSWGTAQSITSGTCTTPVAGSTIGARRSCTVLGLSAATAYQFRLVAFRGTLNQGAVFGPVSNVASGNTAPTAPPPPPPPVLTAPSAPTFGGTEVQACWTRGTGATSQRLDVVDAAGVAIGGVSGIGYSTTSIKFMLPATAKLPITAQVTAIAADGRTAPGQPATISLPGVGACGP